MARRCGSGEMHSALFREGESCFGKEMGEKKGEESTASGTAHWTESWSQTQRVKSNLESLRTSLRIAPEQTQVMNFHFCTFIIIVLS